MQRRSLRGRPPLSRDVREKSPAPPVIDLEEPNQITDSGQADPPILTQESSTVPEKVEEPVQPVKRRPGRPRRSEMKPVEVKAPTPVRSESESGEVVLNARGMPVRQRKRNRYYEEDDDDETFQVSKTKLDKKVKLEPLQMLLDNSGNSIKVTPIISEDFDSEGDSEAQVSLPIILSSGAVQTKNSAVVKIIMPPDASEGSDAPLKMYSPDKIPDLKMYPARGLTKMIPMKANVRGDSGIKKYEFVRVDGYRRSDFSSFIRFFANVKTKVILPDRWGINGVMFDPVRKMKTFTMCELEISPEGEPSVRKCIKIFEDLTVLVSVLGQDLTGKIQGIKRLQSEVDVPGVVSKVNALKICSGVKTLTPQDLNYHPTVKKIGTCYFSADCQTILSLNYVGGLCPACNKLRNTIRRRRNKGKQDRDKIVAKPHVKTLPSTFGRALYGVLDQLVNENKAKRTVGKGTSDSRHDLVGTSGQNRSGSTIKPPRRQQRTDLKRRKSQAVTGSPPSLMGGPINISHLIETNSLGQTVLPPGIVEYLNLGGDGGNIVIQNGSDFTFAEGQEYELIGEADPMSVEPLQLFNPSDDQTIQIIEVDDQTMAQLTAQNISMGGMFFSDPSNIQVTEIDPNDPNALFKVIQPGEIYIQDQKIE